MSEPAPIRFNDGAAYERMMGRWSRLAGTVFIDWLAPPAGLAWLDVGCGSGAFSELIVERAAPKSVHGIDPSPEQLAFARSRPGAPGVTFSAGDAMAIPFADATFDAAVMALVIFFVPVPAKGLAEMVRVVRPGGSIAAYAWDFTRGGFPGNALREEMLAFAPAFAGPPSAEASRIENLKALWAGAGLDGIETREIVVERTFASFEDFWETSLVLVAGDQLKRLAASEQATIKERMRARLPADAAGRVTYSSRANAIKGRRPG